MIDGDLEIYNLHSRLKFKSALMSKSAEIRSRFVHDVPRGASISELVELLSEPEALGSPSRGSKILTYRDLTLQLFFTYDRLDLIGCYFDRGDQTPRDWPGPIRVPPELHQGMTEKELAGWLDAQGSVWSQVTAAGDVRFYRLGEEVRFYTSDGVLTSVFIDSSLPTMGRHQLLEAAVQLASQVGLPNLTLGNLAQAVGHHKAWIAHHFKTKEQLRLAVESHRCK